MYLLDNILYKNSHPMNHSKKYYLNFSINILTLKCSYLVQMPKTQYYPIQSFFFTDLIVHL